MMNASNATSAGSHLSAVPEAEADAKTSPRSAGRAQFEIYLADRVSVTSMLFCGGDWHWRLRSAAGATLADCGGYRNEKACIAAVEGLRSEAAQATLWRHN